MVRIDGGKGEGGGQVLRTALSLSAILDKPFRITNIRARRPQPGLKAQHLTSVRMVANLCRAELKGADKGSRKLSFTPGRIEPGNYEEEVGTAGATTLVAQAAVAPLLCAPGTSLLRIRGGTHVAWAPPLDYLRNVYARVLGVLGFTIRPRLLRYGFYPRGGGQIGVEIAGRTPEDVSAKPEPIRLERPGRKRIRIETKAVASSLPREVAERMIKTVTRSLKAKNWKTTERIVEERGPTGTYVFIRVFSDDEDRPGTGPFIAGGFTGLGEQGKSSEQVAEVAAAEALDFLESNACLDWRMADQILVPALLTGAELAFTTSKISQHLKTNAETISRFLGPCVSTKKTGQVVVRPARRDKNANPAGESK
jgi:RNA 3'-terminal phosphate cyclase (ATP)